jgi:catechol 2,3-dioxygenase-like lactoylglutathione lyase family enzyme
LISGGHVVIYSTDADADRAFLRDVLKLTHVEAGPKGWLIFGLPPAELAIHPSDRNGVHEFFLMCEDIGAFMHEMATHGVSCDEVLDEGWGQVSGLTLPGGGKLKVYEPQHERPEPRGVQKRPGE